MSRRRTLAIGSLANFVVSPRDAIIFVLICIAFFINTVHFGMLIVEFHLAVLSGMVLVPWGIWSQSRHVAEMSIGWVTGGLIRAFERADTSGGEALQIPGNVAHEVEVIEDTLVIDVFSPIRQDWLDKTDNYFIRT